MLIEFVKEADGPEGRIAVGTQLRHPLAYLHVASGLAKALDEEAAEAAEIEMLANKARQNRKRKAREDKIKKEDARAARKRDERKQRIKEALAAKVEALGELEADGIIVEESDSEGGRPEAGDGSGS